MRQISRSRNTDLFTALEGLVQRVWSARRILVTTTIFELRKKYAGSALGILWVILYPVLFLCIYLFLYLVVFKVRFPDISSFQYVIFVFTGLVPFLGLMEVVNSSVVSMRQNSHLIKNVIMPIELVPFRTMLIALASQMSGLVIVLALVIGNGDLSSNIIFFPIVLLLQVMMLAGLAWLLSALGVMLPDLGTFMALLMLFLLFLSPVAFRPDMVPAGMQIILYVNPAHYMLGAFRWALIDGTVFPWWGLGIFTLISFLVFALGAWFFVRFKGFIVDYE